MIKVQINNICAKLTECEPLTSGMIGKTLDVELSADWNNYEKTAVFSNGDVTIDVLESQWSGNTITIPHEVLAKPNRTIVFGMYGFGVENGTTVALPTIYAKIGIPMVGADPTSDPTTDPSLPVYAQLQWQIDHFEISDEQIAQQIQEYLETHPIGIEPATATRLGGVKVGEGLSVTADGTLSADAPDLDGYATEQWVEDKGYLTEHQSLAAYRTAAAQDIIDNSKQDNITDLATIRSGAAKGETAVQPEAGKGLFSGNYNDLSNKPTLFSGNYNDLTNKPTIPTVPQNVSAFTNDSGYLTLSTLPIYDGSVI